MSINAICEGSRACITNGIVGRNIQSIATGTY